MSNSLMENWEEYKKHFELLLEMHGCEYIAEEDNLRIKDVLLLMKIAEEHDKEQRR